MSTTLQKALPPGNGSGADGRRDEDEQATPQRRKRLPVWDRVKFLILLGALFAFTVSADMSSNPILGWTDALRREASSAWWILALAGIELVRQIHMFIGERSAGYHAFWTDRVFGRAEHRMSKFDDWNRFRLARTAKWVVALAIFAFIYAKIKKESVFHAVAALPGDIWHAVPLVVQIMLLMLLAVGQFAAIFWFMSKGGVDVYYPDDVKTRFSDVWGQDHVLEHIKENVFYLEEPEAIESRGGHVPSGILLWGPPGTGKTLMAEAVAGETGRPFVFVDPGAFTAMFFGVGILKVKSLFRKLRKLALRYGGVIVFFDEADTLGNRGQTVSSASPGHPFGAMPTPGDPWAVTHACNGLAYASAGARQLLATPQFVMGGGGGQSGFDGTLQALLAELSGLKKPRGFLNRVVRRALGMRPKPPPKYRILVMMATNMPQSLDAALLRPGRIDRSYKVGYPTKDGRIRTYEGYLAKVDHALTPDQIERLAVISPQATGASIKDVVNEALVIAIREGRETITWPDVLRAKSLKEHGLPDGHVYPTRERHSLALHEACHAVAMYRLMKDKVIEIATIERRGDIGGFVAPVPLEDRFVQWRSEIENDVMTFLASLVGERMFFEDDNTQGVGGDMRAATQIVMQSMATHAMGKKLTSRVASLAPVNSAPIADGSDRAIFDGPFGQQIEEKLQELYDRTERLLAENRREVLAVTHALETYLTISGEDVAAIIEGTTGPSVDGRRYHESEFEGLAEQYHREAVLALHEAPEHLRLAPMPGHGWAAADPRPADPAKSAPSEPDN